VRVRDREEIYKRNIQEVHVEKTIPCSLSFEELQALCLGLSRFPQQHPHRWECITKLVSHLVPTSTKKPSVLVNLPNTRKGTKAVSRENEMRKWEVFIRDNVRLIDKSSTLSAPVGKPWVIACSFCWSNPEFNIDIKQATHK
jgi:hypothetical protein